MSNGDKLDTFTRIEDLPDQTLRNVWNELVVPSEVRRTTLNYAKYCFSVDGEASELDHPYRTVLLLGPPGNGKSSYARALSNEVCTKILGGNQSKLFTINFNQLFSKWEGESAKNVLELVEMIIFSATQQPTFVVGDEVESLAYHRAGTIRSSDPTDLIRAVNALINGMDDLRREPNVLMTNTSNFWGHLDEAFWDRSELKIKFVDPDEGMRFRLVLGRFTREESRGLMLDAEDALVVARETEGLSCRSVNMLIGRAVALTGKDFAAVTREDVLAAAKDLKEEKKLYDNWEAENA